MKLSYLFVVTAVVSVIFGLAFLLVPGPTLAIYDIELSDAGLMVGRLFGAALLTFAVLSWLVRNAEPSEERQAILLAFFIGNGVGFIVSLLGQLAGIANGLGWGTVAIYLILALAFGYYRFMASEVAEPSLST